MEPKRLDEGQSVASSALLAICFHLRGVRFIGRPNTDPIPSREFGDIHSFIGGFDQRIRSQWSAFGPTRPRLGLQ